MMLTRFGVLTLVVALIFSCTPPRSTYESRLINRSSDSLFIQVVYVTGNDFEFFIAPDEEIELIESYVEGGVSPNHPLEGIDNLLIQNSAGLPLQKDLSAEDSWEVFVEPTDRDTYHNLYVTTVKDSDF